MNTTNSAEILLVFILPMRPSSIATPDYMLEVRVVERHPDRHRQRTSLIHKSAETIIFLFVRFCRGFRFTSLIAGRVVRRLTVFRPSGDAGELERKPSTSRGFHRDNPLRVGRRLLLQRFESKSCANGHGDGERSPFMTKYSFLVVEFARGPIYICF